MHMPSALPASLPLVFYAVHASMTALIDAFLVNTLCLLVSLQLSGDITYNGKKFNEFQAVHTAAYVDQNDLHQAELTVRETLDFAARCQGIGHKARK